MMKGTNIGALALLLLLAVGCASDDATDPSTQPTTMSAKISVPDDAMAHIDPVVARLRSLEAQARSVADEKAWSGRYIRSGTVTRAWARGATILLEVWDAEAREYAVHKIDARTGKQRWILLLGQHPLARAPHVGAGTIAFLTDVDAGMTVVDAITGSRIWNKRVELQVIPCSDATSKASTVYVANYLSGRMCAVSAADGRKTWDFRTAGACRTVPVLSWGLANQLLIYGTDAGELVAIDAKEYHEVPPTSAHWTKALNGPVKSDPRYVLLPGDEDGASTPLLVVPCADGWLYGVDPATGRSRWVLCSDAAFETAPQVMNGRVYARNAKRLFCVDAASGERVWFPPYDRDREGYEKQELFGPVAGYEHAERALAANDERVFLLSGRNTVVRCKPDDGTIESEIPLPAFDFFLSNEATDTLIVGTSDGYFVAIR